MTPILRGQVRVEPDRVCVVPALELTQLLGEQPGALGDVLVVDRDTTVDLDRHDPTPAFGPPARELDMAAALTRS